MSFWDDHYTQTDLEKTLESGSFTVEELLDTSTFVDFAKSGANNMIPFLALPENLSQLLNYAISGTEEEKVALRAVRATDGISLNSTLTGAVVEKSELVDKVFAKLQEPSPLPKIQASSVCKLIVRLFRFKYNETIKSAVKYDFVSSIEKHVGNDFIVHMLSELFDEYDTDDHNLLMKYFSEEKLVQRLVNRFVTTQNSLETTNISLIILAGLERFNLSGMNLLTAQLMSSEVLRPLFDFAISETNTHRNDALQLIYRLTIHAGASDDVQFFQEAKRCVKPLSVLLKEPSQKPASQAQHSQIPPLGLKRLLVAKIFVQFIISPKSSMQLEIAQNNVLSTLLNLFYLHSNNNLLHISISEAIKFIFHNPNSGLLKNQLIIECNFVKRTRDHIKQAQAQKPHPSNLGHSLYFNDILNEVAKNDATVKKAVDEADLVK
eukprot:c15119_g1_i1.p1 GENE.c15119_g1_i1~~c15119_g1_i1.p1  ORF type:complete len:453 (-),score=117.79 c15119_g1_i1:53-1357(-)